MRLRVWLVAVVCLLAVQIVFAQATTGGVSIEKPYDPFTSYSTFAAYSNASSHILIGESQDQRLLLLGGSWNVREHSWRWASLRYQAEVIPVALLVSPYANLTQTVTYVSGATPLPNLPAGTDTYTGPLEFKCYSNSYSALLYPIIIVGSNRPPIGSEQVTEQCSHVGTYGGGLSPLGQKISFMPRHRVQPFLVENLGFLVFTRDVPNNQSTRFNFTFEFGTGLEWYARDRRSWSVDIRFHHTSNAFLGLQDPGIDNVMYRVSYSFGR